MQRRDSIHIASYYERLNVLNCTTNTVTRLSKVDDRIFRFFGLDFLAVRFGKTRLDIRRWMEKAWLPLPIWKVAARPTWYCFDEVVGFERAYATCLMHTNNINGSFRYIKASGFVEMAWQNSEDLHHKIKTPEGIEELYSAIDMQQALDALAMVRRSADWKRIMIRGKEGGIPDIVPHMAATMEEWKNL